MLGFVSLVLLKHFAGYEAPILRYDEFDCCFCFWKYGFLIEMQMVALDPERGE